MKTLRFIGMAVVAIIMSLNFAACSDDDEDIDVYPSYLPYFLSTLTFAGNKSRKLSAK